MQERSLAPLFLTYPLVAIIPLDASICTKGESQLQASQILTHKAKILSGQLAVLSVCAGFPLFPLGIADCTGWKSMCNETAEAKACMRELGAVVFYKYL